MKIGIIGASGHYDLVIAALKAGEEMTVQAVARGCIGEDMSSLLAQLSEHGSNPEFYVDYHELLAVETCDFIVVNPWFGHCVRISMNCMRSGFDVYAEKPLATNRRDLESLKKCWKETGRQLGCMLTGRYEPWFQALSSAVEEGRIGEVRLIQAQKSYQYGVRPAFYQEPGQFGGLIPWVGIHALDWIFSLERKETGRGEVHIQSMQGYRGGGRPERTAACMLSFENGVIATMACDYLRPEGAKTHGDDRMRVVGTKGIVEAAAGRLTLMNDKGTTDLSLPEWVNPLLDFAASRGSEEAAGFAAHAFRMTEIALELRDLADSEYRGKAEQG